MTQILEIAAQGLKSHLTLFQVVLSINQEEVNSAHPISRGFCEYQLMGQLVAWFCSDSHIGKSGTHDFQERVWQLKTLNQESNLELQKKICFSLTAPKFSYSDTNRLSGN